MISQWFFTVNVFDESSRFSRAKLKPIANEFNGLLPQELQHLLPHHPGEGQYALAHDWRALTGLHWFHTMDPLCIVYISCIQCRYSRHISYINYSHTCTHPRTWFKWGPCVGLIEANLLGHITELLIAQEAYPWSQGVWQHLHALCICPKTSSSASSEWIFLVIIGSPHLSPPLPSSVTRAKNIL